MALPDLIEGETGPEPTGSVIWLHGLGADGHDFEPIVPELRLPSSLPRTSPEGYGETVCRGERDGGAGDAKGHRQ